MKEKKTKKISILLIIIICLITILMICTNSSNKYNVSGKKILNNQTQQEEKRIYLGNELKTGDAVDYDHTLIVDEKTGETKKIKEEKLKYFSPKGDLDIPGNGDRDKVVDMNNIKIKEWEVFDNEKGDTTIMPSETLKFFDESHGGYKITGALGYLWYEVFTYNYAKLFGYGYGTDNKKSFKYTVGSKIPSENDTKVLEMKNVGARPVILSDVESCFGDLTDDDRNKITVRRKNVGEYVNRDKIYYPTLNKDNANNNGVSKELKKISDIKNTGYFTGLDNLETLKNLKSTTLNKSKINVMFKGIPSGKLGCRYRFNLGDTFIYDNGNSVEFGRGAINLNFYNEGWYHYLYIINLDRNLFDGNEKSFNEVARVTNITPMVYLKQDNIYYKNDKIDEHNRYSILKKFNKSKMELEVKNPYGVDISNIKIIQKADDVNIGANGITGNSIDKIGLKKLDDTEVEGKTSYELTGVPEDVNCELVVKDSNISITMYPKTLNIVAKISEENMYDGANYTMNIKVNKKLFDTNMLTKDILRKDISNNSEIVLLTLNKKEDIITPDGKRVSYTISNRLIEDSVRKRVESYSINSYIDLGNYNKILYNIDIRYDLPLYNSKDSKSDKLIIENGKIKDTTFKIYRFKVGENDKDFNYDKLMKKSEDLGVYTKIPKDKLKFGENNILVDLEGREIYSYNNNEVSKYIYYIKAEDKQFEKGYDYSVKYEKIKDKNDILGTHKISYSSVKEKFEGSATIIGMPEDKKVKVDLLRYVGNDIEKAETFKSYEIEKNNLKDNKKIIEENIDKYSKREEKYTYFLKFEKVLEGFLEESDEVKHNIIMKRKQEKYDYIINLEAKETKKELPTVIIDIYLNGKLYKENYELKIGENKFNVDKYDVEKGKENEYKLKIKNTEEIAKNKFKVEQEGNNIRLEYVPDKISFTTKIIWNLDGGKRKNIKLELFKNGESIKIEEVMLNQNSFTFTGLLKEDENGEDIEYSVNLKEKVKGFNSEIYEKGKTIILTQVEKEETANGLPYAGKNNGKLKYIRYILCIILITNIIEKIGLKKSIKNIRI